jgi:hypothetical protein
LATSFTTFAASALGSYGQAAVFLLSTLDGIEDMQARMLKAIKKDTELIRQGPFRTGVSYLEHAQRPGINSAQYVKYLEHALDDFFHAEKQTASLEELGVVRYHLAITHSLLGEPDESADWMEKSLASTREALFAMALRANNVNFTNDQGQVAIVMTLATFGVALLVIIPAKFIKVWNSEQRCALRAFLPFANTVLAGFNDLILKSPDLTPYRIIESKDGIAIG